MTRRVLLLCAWALATLLPGAALLGCSGPEPEPPPPEQKQQPLERGTTTEVHSPPLSKPRPKLVPGDVLEREEQAAKQEPGQEQPPPAPDGATEGQPAEPAPAEPERTE